MRNMIFSNAAEISWKYYIFRMLLFNLQKCSNDNNHNDARNVKNYALEKVTGY